MLYNDKKIDSNAFATWVLSINCCYAMLKILINRIFIKDRMTRIPEFTVSAPDLPEEKGTTETFENRPPSRQADDIEADLKKDGVLSINDVKRGRSKFQFMTDEHKKRGLSPAASVGLAVAKTIVPTTVAGLIRSRSVSRKRQEEKRERIAADWV